MALDDSFGLFGLGWCWNCIWLMLPADKANLDGELDELDVAEHKQDKREAEHVEQRRLEDEAA